LSVTFKEIFGGSDGRQAFADSFFEMSPFSEDAAISIGPAVINDRQLWTYTVGWSLVALALLITWLLVRSPWGRVVKGIREDEDAVRSLGKNVYAYKMQALVLGGVFGVQRVAVLLLLRHEGPLLVELGFGHAQSSDPFLVQRPSVQTQANGEARHSVLGHARKTRCLPYAAALLEMLGHRHDLLRQYLRSEQGRSTPLRKLVPARPAIQDPPSA